MQGLPETAHGAVPGEVGAEDRHHLTPRHHLRLRSGVQGSGCGGWGLGVWGVMCRVWGVEVGAEDRHHRTPRYHLQWPY